MNKLFKLIVLGALIATPLLADKPEDSKGAEPWESLFDGKSIEGWKNPYDWGTVEIVGDEIHLTADKKFFLITKKEYGENGQTYKFRNLRIRELGS